jgi:hypothetical protein
MTDDEIFSLAHFAYNEAKARDFRQKMKPFELWMFPFILKFHSLIQEMEREECAKLCDEQGKLIGSSGTTCAKGIRLRGQK